MEKEDDEEKTPAPVVPSTEPPHEHGPDTHTHPEIDARLDSLTAMVTNLSNPGEVPGVDDEGDTNPDTKPTKLPWTHRGGR